MEEFWDRVEKPRLLNLKGQLDQVTMQMPVRLENKSKKKQRATTVKFEDDGEESDRWLDPFPDIGQRRCRLRTKNRAQRAQRVRMVKGRKCIKEEPLEEYKKRILRRALRGNLLRHNDKRGLLLVTGSECRPDRERPQWRLRGNTMRRHQ